MAFLASRPLALLLCALLFAQQSSAAINNAVTDWNYAAAKVFKLYTLNHQNTLRYFALTHLAQYKALQWNTDTKLGADPTALLAYAAHHVLSATFPDQQSAIYDVLLANHTAGLTQSAKAKARALAWDVSNRLLLARTKDGSTTWADFVPSPPNGPQGKYQFTPGQTFALYPQLGGVKPFVLSSVTGFVQDGGPAPLGSNKYKADLQVVYSLGSTTSANRTLDQSDTADFWRDGAGTASHGGHWNAISISLLPASLSLTQTARALSLLNIAAYDAAIVGWKQKYKFLNWRPITAIHQGDSFGNLVDATWTTYIPTPAHPEYPSGHSISAGAFVKVLQTLLGGDAINVVISTDGKSSLNRTLSPRTYTSLNAIATEIGWSRVYAGVHFPKAVDDGASLGKAAAAAVYKAFGKVLNF